MMKFKDVLNESLSTKDNKVILAFINELPMIGKNLETDGKILNIAHSGDVAKFKGGKVYFYNLGGKSDELIVKKLKKLLPKNSIAKEIDINAIKISHEMTDGYADQFNYTIFAKLNKTLVGTAEIVLYNKELTISMIEILEDYRRLGIGSKIIKYLKTNNEFSGYKYKPSLKTDLGAKFKAKL